MPAKKQHHVDPESESEDDGCVPAADPSKYFNKNYSREFMATLPEKIRNRTKLLISFDDEFLAKSKEHEKKEEAIRLKYAKLFEPFFTRRRELVTGASEPTDEEIQKGYPESHKEVVSLTASDTEEAEPKKGIPEFWLNAMRHHIIINDMVTERDADVLKHLVDVTATVLEGNGETIVFTFEENEYFKGTQLYKTYFFKQELGQMAVDHSDESTIEWNEDKNVTVEKVTKKQKNKAKKGAVRYVTKEEPCDSFFNLFKKHEEEEIEEWCALFKTLSQKVVPNAIDYYTGEAPDGSSDVDDADMYDDDDDEEEEEEEEEPAPRGRGRGGASGPGRGGRGRGGAPGEKDCKQQ